MLGVNTIRSWFFGNIEVTELAPEPTVNPQPYPYISASGIRYCYITHLHTSVCRNGDDVRYYLVQDAWDGQHRWISDKQIIVQSWFTKCDGVL